MKVTLDREAQAMYFEFMERGLDGSTEELIVDKVIIDKNASGQISGIEIIGIDAIIDLTRKDPKYPPTSIIKEKK